MADDQLGRGKKIMKKMKYVIIFIFVLFISNVLYGCGNNNEENNTRKEDEKVQHINENYLAEDSSSTNNVQAPFFNNLISDMDDKNIYYFKETDIWRINKMSYESKCIYSGDNTILGIAIYEGWIYFLENTQAAGMLSKIDSLGGQYTVINETDGAFIDVSDNILFVRTYTIEGISDALYELTLNQGLINETPIKKDEIVLIRNEILDSIISTNDNKMILMGEELLYEVEEESNEVFIKNYNDKYVVLELLEDGMEYQTLIISLKDKEVVSFLNLKMKYADILNDWVVYIDDSNQDIHFIDMLEPKLNN